MPGWAALPADILVTIMGRLSLPDQVRESAVCAAWRLVSTDTARRPPPVPTLWLMLPRSCEAGGVACNEFATFLEAGKRRYVVGDATNFSYRDCIGSSEGRLMLVDDLGRLHAVNPITGARTHLPSSDAPHHAHPYRKAIFVPGTGGPATVAALRRGNPKLPEVSFARAGVDGEWTSPEVPFADFVDIAAHEGKLYALGRDSRVVVWDLRQGGAPSRLAVEVVETEPNWRSFRKKVLGVMSGEVVMLLWKFVRPCPFRLRRCVPEFEVFRLQAGREPKWVEVEDLGGHAIVLGPDGFTALSTREFPDLRRNCVYSVRESDLRPADGYELEVVDLRSRAVGFQPLCVAHGHAPIWFLPTLA